jgi:hypothetical protein
MPFYDANTGGSRDGLKAWFSAAAVAVGESSSSVEFPSAGLAYAFSPANANANHGFVRDRGAVLVLIALTDEPDKSFEALQGYHDMVASSKQGCGGNLCIVTAGIIPSCLPDAHDPLWNFLSAFGSAPTWTDIDGTAMDYTNVVGGALAQAVRNTCDLVPAAPM